MGAYRPRKSVQMRAIHCKPMLPAVQTYGLSDTICHFTHSFAGFES
jgi:hypothetical protein